MRLRLCVGVFSSQLTHWLWNQLRERVRHFVVQREFAAATFDANFMQGTPTWAVVTVDTATCDGARSTTTPTLTVQDSNYEGTGHAPAADIKQVALLVAAG